MMAVMTEPLLIPPYSGKLVNLVVSDQARDELAAFVNRLPSLQLSECMVVRSTLQKFSWILHWRSANSAMSRVCMPKHVGTKLRILRALMIPMSHCIMLRSYWIL